MLKRLFGHTADTAQDPAAFGRLCVETSAVYWIRKHIMPAAFGRLCVETSLVVPQITQDGNQPPSGGCVLKRCSLSC